MKYIKYILFIAISITTLLTSCEKHDESDPIEKIYSEWKYISNESLDGWTGGICNDICYIVENVDTVSQLNYIYLNLFDAGPEKGLAFTIDQENKVSSFFFQNKQYRVYQIESTLYIAELDESGNTVNTIGYALDTSVDTNSKVCTKSGIDEFSETLELFEGAKETIETITGIPEMAQNVIDRGVLNAIRDEVLNISLLKEIKQLEKPLEKIDALEEALEIARENEQTNMFGSIGISIVNVVKQSANSFVVTVRLTNIVSAPYIWYDFKFQSHYNNLYCGVVGGNKYTYYYVWPSYYNCMYPSATRAVSRGSNSCEMSFLISVNQTYGTIRFRPYIISEREFDGYIAYPKGEFIRYGNGVEYQFNNSSIDYCRTVSATYVPSSDEVRFQGAVNVFQYCEKNTEWGIYMMKNGQRQLFPSKSSALQSSIIDFTAPASEMTLYYNSFTAEYAAQLGVYHKYPDGTISYGDITNCVFTYESYPKIKFTSASITGTREYKRESSPSLFGANPGDDEEDDEEEEEEDVYDYITAFSQSFEIEGAFWIQAVHYSSEGTPSFISPSYSVTKDGSFRTKGEIHYNSNMTNLNSTSYYQLELRDGSILPIHYSSYVNQLRWSGDEKITNVDWN